MVLTAILVITALILVNAVYVAAEFSAVSVRRSRIQKLAEEGNRLAAWLLPILDSPALLDRYIAVCQIGITLSSLVLGAYAQVTLAVWLVPVFSSWGGLQAVGAQSASAIFVLVTLTVLQVLISELVPKSLALQFPTPMSLYTIIPMAPSAWVLRPFNAVLNGSGLILLRLLGAPHQAHRHIHSPEEIELLIADSRDGGLLEPDEHRRLRRALRLNLRQARQLMVSRTKIAALDINTPLDEVIATVARSPFSRLPVYRDSIDNIVGMLHTKDLVRWYVSNGRGTLADIIRPMASVHESVTADRVLKQLRERRSHQALVVDEHGGTAGLVTLEDVLSELLGDVGDEFKPGEPVPETLPDGRVRLPGGMSVDDAATLLNVDPWQADAATVGGLVIGELGHLPAPGESVRLGEYELTVERVAGHAVATVIARRVADLREAGG